MKNIIDYTIEENDTFKNRKFNAANSLVLSQLAYLRFDKFVPGLSDTAMPVSIKEIASKENLDTLFRDTWNDNATRAKHGQYVDDGNQRGNGNRPGHLQDREPYCKLNIHRIYFWELDDTIF